MATRLEILHVVSGGDEYRQRLRVTEIVEQTISPEARDFDLTRLHGEGLTPEQATIAIATPPFFSSIRLVLIEAAERMPRQVQDALLRELDYATNASTLKVVLVYQSENAPSRSVLDRAGQHEVIAPFKSPKAATSWLDEYVRSQHLGHNVSRRILEHIVMVVGETDSGRLAREIDKLIEMAGDRPLRIEDVVTGTQEQAFVKPYEFYDNVGERRIGHAQRLLRRLLEQPDFPGVRIVIGLASHLIKLGHARALLDAGQNPSQVDSAFRGYFGERLVRQARGWHLKEIDRALSALCETDLLLKTGASEPHALEAFLARIAT